MKALFWSLLLVPVLALAQQTSVFTVADDSSSGTYKKMLGEIIGVCSDEGLDIKEVNTGHGGAPDNLLALYNNKAMGALLHSDVYFANAQADPTYKKLQTLVALYPEPIHVLALRNSKSSKSGTFAFGKQDFNTLADMRGYAVGAAGGGVFTARILMGQGQGGFRVQQYDTGKAVIEALTNGDIAAAIFVGAAPLPNIENLSGSVYKLIPIGEAISNNVSGVYRPVTINYPGLTNGPLKTLAPLATLLTRKYNTPEKLNVQRKFRECFYNHLDELKDSGSPNWQAVEAGDHGVLDWYEIPTATPVRR